MSSFLGSDLNKKPKQKGNLRYDRGFYLISRILLRIANLRTNGMELSPFEEDILGNEMTLACVPRVSGASYTPFVGLVFAFSL